MTAETSTQLHADLALPNGYTHRTATIDDAEAVAELYNVAYKARGEHETFTAEFIRNDWNEPRFDLATSSQVFFNPQGDLVGCVTVWDHINPSHPWIEWEVLPTDEHWRTVTQSMLAWGEQTSQRAIARLQPDERFAPVSGILTDATEQVALMEAFGYRPARYFYRMGITMTEAPTPLPMPDGFTLRTFDPSELETLVKAKDDAWHDHYGYIPRPLEDIVADWRHSIETDDKFDPTLWFLGIDDATGEMAGLVLGRIEDHTNANEGYIQIVAVGRAYRKKGLAQAMLTHAFAEYWKRDQKTVCLGVDASSPTGATRLYERVGMSPMRRFMRMEKELRAGIERMNTGN